MELWGKNRIQLAFSIVILLLMAPFLSVLLPESLPLHLLFFFIFVFIVSIAILFGTVAGLVAAMSYIFFIGSFLFYASLTPFQWSETIQNVSFIPFLTHGFLLLIATSIAGFIHQQMEKAERRRIRLEHRVSSLVATDEATGFDNVERMKKELIVEQARARRYHTVFSFVMIRMNHSEQFLKLYGLEEFNRLIQTIAEKMEMLMRITDRKFRYDLVSFGVLLPYTDEEGAERALEKLKEELEEYMLTNGHYVTLTFRKSVTTYHEEEELNIDQLLIKIERELKSHDL